MPTKGKIPNKYAMVSALPFETTGQKSKLGQKQTKHEGVLDAARAKTEILPEPRSPATKILGRTVG